MTGAECGGAKDFEETTADGAIATETAFADFDDEKKAEEIYFGVKRLKKHSLDAKKMQLSSEIAAFEAGHDKKGASEALAKFQALLEEEKNIS